MSVSPKCMLLVEGYVDVKTPPDSPERILYKAWRRQWVSATAYIPSGRGEPHLIVLVSRTPEDQPSAQKQVKASRDGLRLFRCRSGSRPLQTWALASGSSLLLYLAGKTEEETQRWMAAIRDGLWPPILVVPSQTGTCHEVSLIDDEKSFASGLLGVYGRLVHTSENVISVIHPYWQGTQMRWRLDDILDVRLIRTVGKDKVAGVFHIALSSTGSDTRTLLFYCNTATTTIEWVRGLLQAAKSDQRTTSQKVNSSLSPIQTTTTNCLSNTSSEYAVVQKSQAAKELNAVQQTGNGTLDDLEIEAKSIGRTLIPDAFLDASMSSSMFGQTKMDKSPNTTGENEKVNGQESDEDSDDSSTEIYEHLYEDLDTPLKETRSYTVYEEMDDGADEYVPPMPPSLPNRQPAAQHQVPGVKSLEPAALRLQKLCDSVTEALKLAEETPVASGDSDSLQKQKRKKKDIKALVKHESLRRSPKGKTELSAVAQLESAGALKRVVSDSEIKRASINGCDLPLMPFNYRTESDSYNKKESRLEKPNHLPLKDILKNLKVGSDGGNVIGRRNSEKHKISQSVGRDGKLLPSSRSEETESQYLDMI